MVTELLANVHELLINTVVLTYAFVEVKIYIKQVQNILSDSTKFTIQSITVFTYEGSKQWDFIKLLSLYYKLTYSMLWSARIMLRKEFHTKCSVH